MTVDQSHREMANALRALSIDAVEAAKSGHPGLPMGAADIATVLFRDVLRFDAAAPDWPDRDRFVLSAGHGSMLLYALLHLVGVGDVTLEELKRFRQLGSKTPGHPEFGHTQGVEMTTGPLGQGLATAVGMAMAERKLNARFGDALVDHRTYVLASDGDLMEGISHEAAHLAGRLRLARLIVLFDDNAISIDGDVALSETGDQLKRFEAAGWRAERVDGHDPDAVHAALTRAQDADRPSLIACRTTIGFGAPTKAGTAAAHGAPLGPEEAGAAKKALGCDWPPFVVPDAVRAAWAAVGRRGADARRSWRDRFEAMTDMDKAAFKRALDRRMDEGAISRAVAEVKRAAAATKPVVATRKASGMTLDALAADAPELMGGSADLTGSNNTFAKGQTVFDAPDYAGSYIHYGVREHAMAAAMNGMVLHGGVRAYGGTFLVFSDYCRPSIRLAALMGAPSVFVFTHDSIGVGEDGPTHQPVEHLAALRAIPNLYVFRPADVAETAEAWEIALEETSTPSCLVLSRQDLPTLREIYVDRNRTAGGAYVLIEETGAAPDVTLVGSGSELHLAVEAARALRREGIDVRVVSAPCLDLFAERPADHRELVIPTDRPVVMVEAALGFGLEGLLGRLDHFVGMSGFGASAPAKDLFGHFAITAQAVIQAARRALERSAKRA